VFFWGHFFERKKKEGQDPADRSCPKQEGMEGLAFPIPVKFFNINCIEMANYKFKKHLLI